MKRLALRVVISKEMDGLSSLFVYGGSEERKGESLKNDSNQQCLMTRLVYYSVIVVSFRGK